MKWCNRRPSPRPPPGVKIHEGDSHNSTYSSAKAKIYYRERIQSKIGRGERCGGWGAGGQGRASTAPLPPLPPPPSKVTLDTLSTSRQHVEGGVYQGACERLGTQGWSWGAGHVSTPCLACTKFSDSQKAGVLHKPYCLYKKVRHRQPLFSVLEMAGTLPKSKFPDPSFRQILLRKTVSRLHTRGLLLFSLFYR